MNPVHWFEIATTDLEHAKHFYESVFGLSFTFIDMPDAPMYVMGSGPDAPGTAGCLVCSKDNVPSMDGVTIYFSCEDVNTEAGRVEAAGGKLLFPKMSIGEFGFIAQFLDTEGNRIGLHSNA